MTDDDDLPRAEGVRSRWPGLVWAIPLAALIIVAFLGIRALFHHGEDVTVTFGDAEGVTPGDTKVLVHGVEAGHVTHVQLAPGGKRVEVTLSLDPRLKRALNTNSMFWLLGENPTITDIQSIRAAIAGVIIEMAPGSGGTPTHDFDGLDSPPVINPGEKGSFYFLTARSLGSVQPGAVVSYRGLPIGKVVRTGIIGLERFRMQMYIDAPFDRLVKPDAEFWSGSPLKLSLSGASLSAGLSSPASVLQGSVQFDLPYRARNEPQAPAGTAFELFDDQSSADQGKPGPEVAYRVVFDGDAGDLSRDSLVTMQGYTIGRVRWSQLVFAPGGRPYTEATIAIFPKKLDVDLGNDAAPSDWRGPTDRAVSRLLAQGFRATLTQSPPLVGAHQVTLAIDHGARPRGLEPGAPYPTIPTASGGAGAGDLIDKADQILTKVNGLPLAAIGTNVRQLTGNLAQLTGSGQVRDSLQHLNKTLAQLDRITAQVSPQVGPLMTKLNATATELQGTAAAARATLSGEGAAQDRSLPDAIQQLDEAARSIRALTDYLGRHPESLIKGKAKEKN